jgi:mono/diheme cytochrome c family protein
MSWLLKYLFVALLGASLLTGCSCSNARSKQTNVEVIQDMMDQPALKAQDYEPGNPEQAASRLPPDGTVPVGYKPYKYKMNPAAAEAALKNPLAGDAKVLEIGRTKFETYCAVCHGPQADGKGTVAAKMSIQVPSLLSAKVRAFNDGRIFHIITDGQGVMSSYAFQLTKEDDRWAIVNYIRSLQKLSGGQGQ